MKKFGMNYDEKQIVYAVVRMDRKNKEKGTGRTAGFWKRGSEAIRKAEEDIDVGYASPEIRKEIVEKLYQSIAFTQPWELLGETYCSRGTFYSYRKKFCFLIADNMGMIDAKRRGSRTGKEAAGKNGKRIQ
jgi:hypothetical protein